MLGVVSVIAFRLILIATMFQATKTFPEFFQKYARVMATGVAAFINAIIIEVKYFTMRLHQYHVPFNLSNFDNIHSGDHFIQVSGFIFQMIARKCTDLETPRTQMEYETSYTVKMFLFQFINYYASLIYTAFFKVRKDKKYH